MISVLIKENSWSIFSAKLQKSFSEFSYQSSEFNEPTTEPTTAPATAPITVPTGVKEVPIAAPIFAPIQPIPVSIVLSVTICVSSLSGFIFASNIPVITPSETAKIQFILVPSFLNSSPYCSKTLSAVSPDSAIYPLKAEKAISSLVMFPSNIIYSSLPASILIPDIVFSLIYFCNLCLYCFFYSILIFTT